MHTFRQLGQEEDGVIRKSGLIELPGHDRVAGCRKIDPPERDHDNGELKIYPSKRLLHFVRNLAPDFFDESSILWDAHYRMNPNTTVRATYCRPCGDNLISKTVVDFFR